MSQQTDRLGIRNRAALRARLRFHHGAHAIWDSWIEPDGQMQLPNPRLADMAVRAHHTDPSSQVGYTVSTRLLQDPMHPGPAGRAVRLVAKLAVSAGACGFEVSREAHPASHEMALLNLTRGPVNFECQFCLTPFVLLVQVPSQGCQNVGLDAVQVSATVDGYTTSPMPIDNWCGELLIETSPDADHYPHLRLTQPRRY